MRDDLKPMTAARAQVLLATVRELGSLTAAALALRISRRQAIRCWHKWQLDIDCPLRSGRHPAPASNSA